MGNLEHEWDFTAATLALAFTPGHFALRKTLRKETVVLTVMAARLLIGGLFLCKENRLL